MSLQREKRPKFKMWKSLMNRKRKYSEQPCDRESYAALAAMQGGNAATLPPSLDALRACEYGRYSTLDGATAPLLIKLKSTFTQSLLHFLQ
ncbi:Pho91p [Operophtera brumata]|uniref:Pho91p n=1 Tax=Operophtera brumata TaxID=104452 RepID=A0A0L7KU56_OPEBR|nr:Pho91p [Operophtera brumata]